MNMVSTRAAAAGGNEQRAAPPVTARLTAAEIYTAAVQIGEDELKRSSTGLALSGLAAGLGMGLTGLGSAAILADVGDRAAHHLLATLLYPLGFIVVIVGRAQLFTENTLFPVILVLDRRRHLRNTLRLWAVVFIANVVGALLFAVLMIRCGAVSPEVARALSRLGSQTVQGSFGHLFWAGVAGGWIIALMAWLVTASRFTIGQIALVYLMTFVVGAAGLAHCIAGSTEALSAVLAGQVSAGTFVVWLLAATLGNTVGGVIIVSLLNYGQVVGSGRDLEQVERPLADIEADATGNSQRLRIRQRRQRRQRRDNTF
jgi:formate/nitrite transporter FocA (FNT family)